MSRRREPPGIERTSRTAALIVQANRAPLSFGGPKLRERAPPLSHLRPGRVRTPRAARWPARGPGRGEPSAGLVPVLGADRGGQDPAGQSARRAAVPDMSIRTSASSVTNRRRALGSMLEKSDIPSPDRRADQADHPQRPPDGTLQRPGAVLLIEPSRARRATNSLAPNGRAPSRCRPSAMTASTVSPSGTSPAMIARVSSLSTISSIRLMNSGRNAPQRLVLLGFEVEPRDLGSDDYVLSPRLAVIRKGDSRRVRGAWPL